MLTLKRFCAGVVFGNRCGDSESRGNYESDCHDARGQGDVHVCESGNLGEVGMCISVNTDLTYMPGIYIQYNPLNVMWNTQMYSVQPLEPVIVQE